MTTLSADLTVIMMPGPPNPHVHPWIPHTMPENLWRTQTSLSATFSHIQLNCCPIWIILPYYHYFRADILPLKQHVTAGGPLFSVLLSWKLLLILTFQHFLHALHNKFESSARPFEPLRKMLTMPFRLLGSWFEILEWRTKKNKGWMILHFMNNNTF